MICVHCGKEIDNGQAFCPYCGSRVGGDAAPEAKAAKKDPRKLALPVAAVALLAVVGVGLANRMPSIDLQRYVTITAQGYDTLGKLDVSFDTDKLEADYGKRIADSFKKALDLLSKGLYYATMASSFVVLLMWGGFCGLFGAKSAPFFVLVNMHDGQRDAIAHMFIDRCAHDLKTHRYKPLLAPGIALTLIYLYLEYLSLDPYFWLTRVFRFVYNPLSWICFFLFAGLLVLDAVHAANTYKQYRHLENTIGAAVYFYLFKMARVPGKIGFAVGLMLIMDIFGNYPYLFPIMVTGWLAMQACSKMVTGSADLKY